MKQLCALTILACATGCGSLAKYSDGDDRRESFEQYRGVDIHSSYPGGRRTYFEQLNLIELIDPEGHARELNRWKYPDDKFKDKIAEPGWGAKYDLVMADFLSRKDLTDDEKRLRRNSIQERMLSVSISRCNVFKTYLRRDQADRNFWFGTAATVSGVLGAVLPGIHASRNLAGAAGLFSGVRSEYNQAYFASLAAHVIVKAIETRQEATYRRIQTEGQVHPIGNYPLEAAIKDAVYFDGLCSVVAGLDQASDSVSATAEPGLEAATRTMLKARVAREALEMSRDDLLKTESLDKLGAVGARLGMSLVGTVRRDESAKGDLFSAAEALRTKLQEAVKTAAKAIERTATERFDVILGKLSEAERAAQTPKFKAAAVALAPKAEQLMNEKILGLLKLELCYDALGKPKITARDAQIAKRATAADEATKLGVELLIKDAIRAVDAVYDKFNEIESLAKLDIARYVKERGDYIGSKSVITDFTTIGTVLPDPTRTSSTGKECGVATAVPAAPAAPVAPAAPAPPVAAAPAASPAAAATTAAAAAATAAAAAAAAAGAPAAVAPTAPAAGVPAVPAPAQDAGARPAAPVARLKTGPEGGQIVDPVPPGARPARLFVQLGWGTLSVGAIPEIKMPRSFSCSSPRKVTSDAHLFMAFDCIASLSGRGEEFLGITAKFGEVHYVARFQVDGGPLTGGEKWLKKGEGLRLPIKWNVER